MNKIACDVIKDLLPLYVDNVCSEKTKDLIEEHLAGCEECQQYYEALQEGLPVAIMEAMACGLPIIASNIRGNIDLIEPEKGGWLVPPTDVDGFAAAIRDAMARREIWPQMRTFNLAKVRHYSIDAVVEQMASIYRDMM